MRGEAPLKIIQVFLDVFDYLDYLRRNFPNHAERQENVGELLHFAAQFSSTPEFLEQVSLLQATDNIREDRGDQPSSGYGRARRKEERGVQLMTIHLAKGLEFDSVYIVGCAEGLLPHARSMESETELEEERRLIYVAITRARRELCLSFYDLPSRFLSEIPPELLEFKSLVSDEDVFSDSEERYITLE